MILFRTLLRASLLFSYVIPCKILQVLSEYRKRGMDFVMQVINEPTYLEDLTGLTDLMKSAAYSQVEWVDETDEDDFVEI